MKVDKYLRSLQKINSVREKRATRGERILSALFPNRGVGYPSGWQSDRLEQVQHLRHWTYVAIHTIASKIASITPNIAYVTDAPKVGHTTKVCNRTPYQFGGESFISEGGHSFLTMGAYRSKSLSVVKPHEELEPLEAYHPLRRLFENPNAVDTFFDLGYELQMFDELCGVNYLWSVPNAAGVPCELWVIPSHWVWPRTGGSGAGSYVNPERPDAGKLIQYYEIRPWGGMGSAGVLRLPPEEVIMSAWKSPLNKIDGYSKLYAAAQWIDSEESISRSRWSQFQNQARPEFWVELGPGYEDPDDDRISRLEAKFAAKIQGEYNYGKPVITPPGAKITPLSFNPTEMAYYQCLSDDTECLTSDGWKKYTELTLASNVLCYDGINDTFYYSVATKVYRYEYNGLMCKWESPGVDALMTPNHRTYLSKETLDSLYPQGYELRLASELGISDSYRVMVYDGFREGSRLARGEVLNPLQRTTIPYKGDVWCVTVPTGLFVVRRNGKAHVTGNSEEQIRDMILAAFQVPKTAVGISNDMTYGSLLASLSQLCAYCLNPRLAQRGQSLTKHLGSRWDQRSPSYSTLTGKGYGGSSIVRRVRIWYDDCVPADPTQVNADIAEDRANYAITPNEVRALRGRKAYRVGGDDPIAPGPGGVMPFPLNTGEDLEDLAELIKPMTQQSQEGDQGGMPRMTGGGMSEGSGEPGEEGPESLLPDDEEGEGGLEELDTGSIEEPNGKPSKGYTSFQEKGWDSEEHPRGQPENAGQFSSKPKDNLDEGDDAGGVSEGGISQAEDYKKNGVRAKAFKAWFGDWEGGKENASKVVKSDTGEPQESHGIPGGGVMSGGEDTPLIVYHGTTAKFNEFSISSNVHTKMLGVKTFFFTDNKAVASTYAPGEAGRLMPVYLNLRNPLVIDANGREWLESLEEIQDRLTVYYGPKDKEWKDRAEEIYANYDPYDVELGIVTLPDDEAAILESLRKEAEWERITTRKKLKLEAADSTPVWEVKEDGIIIRNSLDMTANSVNEEYSEGGYSPFADIYVAFHPNQIKSVNNSGSFDSDDDNIYKGWGRKKTTNTLDTSSRQKSLKEDRVEEFRHQLGEFSGEELDGIGVWYNPGPPSLILIDVMDWGDGGVGKRIGKLASKVVGKDRVVWQNEGATPSKDAGWENLVRGIGLPADQSKGVDTFPQKRYPTSSLSEETPPVSPLEENSSHTPVVAVDLDGTLAEYDGWKGEDHFGELRAGAREALERLKARGCRIIVFTTRGNVDPVMDWLESNQVPYDYINENPDQPEGSSGKVIADVYVDDRAVDARPSWEEVYEEVLRRISKGVGRVVVKTPGPHKYSSTQFNLEDAGFLGESNPLDGLIQLRDSIVKEDLGGDGREEELHVTVKYGLHTDDPEEVRELVEGFGVVRAVLGKVSIFPASESGVQRSGESYDVVKVEVESSDLHRLNELLSALPHTDSHPEYQPHITLGYVKVGEGEKYVGGDEVDGMEVYLGELVFSDKSGNRDVIKLGGERELGVVVRKGKKPKSPQGGPCEPGQTAEETGCIPASSLGGKSSSRSEHNSRLGADIKSPSLGSVVTVGGGRYVVESLDEDDSFPPAVAGYELRDGYLFYHGRNGSEGVVSGTKEEMFKWMGEVEQEVRDRPHELEEQKPWTPDMGGEELVVRARNAGVKTAQLFGVTPLRLDFTQRDATYGEGGSYSGHGSASVVNAHLDLPSSFDFDTPDVTRGMHIASHETMHEVFSAHSESGRRVMGLMGKVGSVSLYGAVAGSLESLMELGAAYVTAPEELKKFNPKAFQVINDWARECRNESKTKSIGSTVRKSVGSCKPGQTSASTGCTPATGSGGKTSSSTSPQEILPISPPSEENARQHLSYSHFNEGVKKLESIKDTVTRFGKAGYEELGPPAKRALVRTWAMAKWVEHKVSVGFRKSKQVAERVAQERGMSAEGAARLAKMLGIADMVTAWTINMPATLAVTGSMTLAKVSSWVPVASLAYIGYSTARNPLAVLRAARATLLKAAEHKGLLGSDFVNELADALEQSEDQDWLMALWCVALDEEGNASKALAKAKGMASRGSYKVPMNDSLTEADVSLYNFPPGDQKRQDVSSPSEPANRLGR